MPSSISKGKHSLCMMGITTHIEIANQEPAGGAKTNHSKGQVWRQRQRFSWWTCGATDNALDYESRDCRFESCQVRQNLFPHFLCKKRPSLQNGSPPGGLEPPTFRLTAERASRLRHGGFMIWSDFCQVQFLGIQEYSERLIHTLPCRKLLKVLSSVYI